jgi:large subunit ribosomal protein L10
VNREEKAAATEALQASFRTAKAAVLTDFRGLTVADMTDLRRHLRKASVEYAVVKNTLAVRALGAGGMEGLAPYFEGPTGIAISRTDPLAPARALMAWAKGRPTFTVKAGLVEGVVMGPAEIAVVAALPGREVLLSRLLSVLQAPVRNLASVLHGQVRALAAVLDQVRHQKAKAEGESASTEPSGRAVAGVPASGPAPSPESATGEGG